MTAAAWLRRQFRADAWPPILLALTVGLVSALVVLGPRVVGDLGNRALTGSLGSLSAQQGDVVARWRGFPAEPDASADPARTYLDEAQRIRAEQPAELRTLLTEAQLAAELGSPRSLTPPQESGYWRLSFASLVDPGLVDHAELVTGSWPAPPAPDDETVPTDVVLLHDAAERLGWVVGDAPLPGTTLVGTYRPRDPDDTRWQHIPRGAGYAELADPNLGTEMASAFLLHPASLAVGAFGERPQVIHELWFGLDASALERSGADSATLAEQLTGLLARTHDLTPADGDLPPVTARFSSELGQTLIDVSGQQRTITSLFTALAIGPLSIAGLLVGLATTLVLARRRTATALLTARGLSRTQLNRLAAVEGAALTLPAAVLGHLAAALALPRTGYGWQWAVTAVLAVVLAAALPIGQSRADVGVGRRASRSAGGRMRVALEALVVGLAAVATWQLLQRPERPDGDIDLLAAAAPVLLSLAATALLWRLLPVPLRALARWLTRRRGLAAMLGVLRAVRDPAGGVVPLVALVLGTSMAFLGAVLGSSLETTSRDAAWSSNGADVRIAGPWMTDDLVARIRGVDGVAHVARIHRLADGLALTAGDERRHVSLWATEPELLDVYAATPADVGLPPALFLDADRPAIVVGGDAAAPAGDATLQGVGDVTVLGHLGALPGAPTQSSWALLSAGNARAAGQDPGFATLALVSLDDDAIPAAVADALRDQLATGVVTTAADQLEGWHVPASRAFTQVISWLLVSTIALMVLAVVGAQLLGGASRTETLAVLTTLGAPPGHRRRVVAWELAPVLAIAMLSGVLIGSGLAALLLASLDYSFITGTHAATLSVDPVTIGAIAGLLALAFALIVMGGSLAPPKEES